MLLPHPTIELVNAEAEEFDREYQVIEEAIKQLVRKFPHNTDIAHVLLKVVVINDLYGAGIPQKYVETGAGSQKYVETIARHIAGLNIDEALAEGKAAVVDSIINCGGITDKYLSFASKFCSWHNPTAYPIYDYYVRECLWSYKQQDHFATFRRRYSYVQFVAIVDAFRNFYGLNSVTFKQLDNFLWRQGQKIS